MRLFRVCFDIVAFVLPAYAPGILWMYLAVHWFAPSALHVPRRLDRVRHVLNVNLIKH